MINPLNFIKKLVKSSNQKELDRLQKILQKINILENWASNLKNEDFPKQTKEFKNKIKQGSSLDQLLQKRLL